MRTLRALLVVLLLGVLGAATVAIAVPSAAGGPTSVLLVDPATGRTAALSTTDARYQRLSALVGADDPDGAGGGRPAGAPRGGDVGPTGGINVTWLVHDVQVWRVDRIYLAAPGGPWVASQSDLTGSGSLWDVEPTWRRPSSTTELVALLDALGVGPADGTAGSAGDLVAAPAPSGAAATAAAPDARAATRTAAGHGTVPGPLWAVGGLAMGAVLALGAARLRQKTRPHGQRARAAIEPVAVATAPVEASPAQDVSATTDAEVLTSHP
jgi:hypothetical protein